MILTFLKFWFYLMKEWFNKLKLGGLAKNVNYNF